MVMSVISSQVMRRIDRTSAHYSGTVGDHGESSYQVRPGGCAKGVVPTAMHLPVQVAVGRDRAGSNVCAEITLNRHRWQYVRSADAGARVTAERPAASCLIVRADHKALIMSIFNSSRKTT
jgi:hypothetical protein